MIFFLETKVIYQMILYIAKSHEWYDSVIDKTKDINQITDFVVLKINNKRKQPFICNEREYVLWTPNGQN